jgi:hypothetical protein
MKLRLLFFAFILFFFKRNAWTQADTTIPAIHKVIVSNGILLQIERSPVYSLTSNIQSADENCLQKSIANGILTLKLTGSVNCKGKVSVNLTCPKLTEMEIMGNADVSSRNLLSWDTLKMTLKSGGKAYVDLDVKTLDVRLAEGSLLTGSGYALNQKVNVTTNATYSCFDLEGDHVDVEASFGGVAKVCAAKELMAVSKTGGYIGYKCNPANKSIEKKGNGVIVEESE